MWKVCICMWRLWKVCVRRWEWKWEWICESVYMYTCTWRWWESGLRIWSGTNVTPQTCSVQLQYVHMCPCRLYTKGCRAYNWLHTLRNMQDFATVICIQVLWGVVEVMREVLWGECDVREEVMHLHLEVMVSTTPNPKPKRIDFLRWSTWRWQGSRDTSTHLIRGPSDH